MEPEPWTSSRPPPPPAATVEDDEDDDEEDGASLEMGPMRLERSWTCSGPSLALNLIVSCTT